MGEFTRLLDHVIGPEFEVFSIKVLVSNLLMDSRHKLHILER